MGGTPKIELDEIKKIELEGITKIKLGVIPNFANAYLIYEHMLVIPFQLTQTLSSHFTDFREKISGIKFNLIRAKF